MALRRRAEAVALVVLALLTAGVGAVAVRGALAGPPSCGRSDPVASATIAALSVGAFGLGHLAARFRTARDPASTSHHPLASALLVRATLVLLLFVVLLVLVYETAALARLDGLQPITAYVRCARSADPRTTALAAAVVAFLAGHWLWFPGRRR